ncbi:MAG: fumarate hydratase [Spirochaetes bacterium]|nr:fumarate hydratase [Spirochaetota bacterium]MBL7006072.1 fumarate hydratase [Spirochaetia bacterium]
MKKKIGFGDIEQSVYNAVLKAGVILPEDVKAALQKAYMDEASSGSARESRSTSVISKILENLDAAEKMRIPMCQDTGMVIIFADIGTEASVNLSDIDNAVNTGIAAAFSDGYFRKSVVSDPLFGRENTGNNLPAVIYHQLVPGNLLTLQLMLKGFGSENCSGLVMLNPTAGIQGVISAVTGIVAEAGGKPCPPIIAGVGIGGTADRAMQLSKRALLRDVLDRHPDSRYAELEEQILLQLNGLHIGPGGLGGVTTAMAVKVEAESTHIAGLPVGVSISCWADRKQKIVLGEE